MCDWKVNIMFKENDGVYQENDGKEWCCGVGGQEGERGEEVEDRDKKVILILIFIIIMSLTILVANSSSPPDNPPCNILHTGCPSILKYKNAREETRVLRLISTPLTLLLAFFFCLLHFFFPEGASPSFLLPLCSSAQFSDVSE